MGGFPTLREYGNQLRKACHTSAPRDGGSRAGNGIAERHGYGCGTPHDARTRHACRSRGRNR